MYGLVHTDQGNNTRARDNAEAKGCAEGKAKLSEGIKYYSRGSEFSLMIMILAIY